MCALTETSIKILYYKPISLMIIDVIIIKLLGFFICFQQHIKGITYHDQVEFHLGLQSWPDIWNHKCNPPLLTEWRRKATWGAQWTEEQLAQPNTHLWLKQTNKPKPLTTRHRRELLQRDKGQQKKPHSYHHASRCLSSLLLNNALKVLVSVIRKKIKLNKKLKASDMKGRSKAFFIHRSHDSVCRKSW